ncbi:hypothetical protein [Clostridium tyrobutyricum]|uniref:hypothetical protein n=1 Tax=Clostridium tyrobutyricum TaxID=1519 RepID=UPI001C37EE87|nr:hypothetical protein [Clostridium tyrobutyricum]MBV4415460.1 hypothetical protein [Clostridium tyrobutyricum]MEA5007222.1 hypothetical protein [Clostridium tyrobutyricum]
MKKIPIIILFIVVIMCILIFLKKGYSTDPYIGKYECPQNNLILILSKNNNFTVIDSLYKDALYIKGKYSIKNNNIKLILNENNSGSYRKLYFNGKIEGRKIQFDDFYKNNAVFYLQK